MKEELEKLGITHKKKLSLTEYIGQNQKLITVIGVFTALAIFANNITLDLFRSSLSFLFITLAVIVWLELFFKKFDGKLSWRLELFDAILVLTVLILIGYWLIEYLDTWRTVIVVPIFIFFNSIFSYTLKKFDFFKKLNNPKPKKFKLIKTILFYFIILFFIWLAMFLTGLVRDPIVELVNEQKQNLEKIY